MSIKLKHIISGILLLLVVAGVIFLTLQGPEDTVKLSESFRKVAWQIGYTGDARQFRSDIHIIEYFIVGLFAVIFVKSIGIKIWIGIVSTCIIGILDETVKILLPTREFSFIDLIKDFAVIVSRLLLLMCNLHFEILNMVLATLITTIYSTAINKNHFISRRKCLFRT